MLSSIPVIGFVFAWLGKGACIILSTPAPQVVVDTLKAGCNWILGGCS